MNPCTARTARFLNKSEIAHLGLEAPPVFIKVNRKRLGIEDGTYTVKCGDDFVQDASTLEALIEFLSFSVVSTGETFEVPACNRITCTRSDGSEITYDLHRDYRI